MNTKRSIEELNQILRDLNRLKEKTESIFQQLDSAVERLSDEILDTDYGTTLEDARDGLENSLWDGFDTVCSGISDTIFSLTLLEVSDKMPQEVDGYWNGVDEEESLGGFDMNAGGASAVVGHHLAQRRPSSLKNDTKGFSENGYNPFDTHGESSFNWMDEDGDGYDDRDDGFWTEREF